MRIAGIDIGTLTCRLLIAEIGPNDSLREIDSDRRILRLGEGVGQTHVLDPTAMDRVLETLREWRMTIASHSVNATVAVATSAVREAKNRQEFLDTVKQKTGIDIEVLTGDEEARRTLLGLEFGLPAHVDSILGVDIGGGSTEFIRAVKSHRRVMVSLDIGVVRLTEQYLHSDPPQEQEVLDAEQHIRSEMKDLRETIGDLASLSLVGTAGTVTTLAAMAQQLAQYEPARIHNYSLALEKIYELENKMRARTAEERAQLAGLEAGRAEVIVGGTIILRVIMETLGFTQCLVSDYGLREGILVDLFNKENDC